MTYRALINIFDMETGQEIDFSTILDEEFKLGEFTAHKIAECKSFEEAKRFLMKGGYMIRDWENEDKREDWIETFADEMWRMTYDVKVRGSRAVYIRGYDASGDQIFMRRITYACQIEETEVA